MNFSYGVIAAVGVLVAISLVLIAADPSDVMNTEMPPVEKPKPAPVVSIPDGVGSLGCEMTNSCYSPYEITVETGMTITWNNDDVAVHTVTSGKDLVTDDLFDSGIIAPNESFESTFSDAGTFHYFCIVHPWMTGIVHVN